VPAGFLADGPAERTVRGRITDKDGGFTDYTTTIGVHNVAPTVSVGVPSDATEGTAVLLTSSVTDPGTDTFSYQWTVTRGEAVVAEGTDPTLEFTPDDDGTYAVTLVVTDDDGGTTTATAELTVGNAAPTAVFSGDAAVDEGSTATVAFSGQADASAIDLAAGFAYSYDFDNDGTFEITDSASASAVVPASYLADGPGGRTVRGRITDKDGGFTDYTTTINIDNVAPTAAILGAPASAPQGQSITLHSQVTDPGADTFGYHWQVDLGGDTGAEGTDADFTFMPTPPATITDGLDDDGGEGVGGATPGHGHAPTIARPTASAGAAIHARRQAILGIGAFASTGRRHGHRGHHGAVSDHGRAYLHPCEESSRSR
jgi:hypothetical protein